MLTSLIRWGYPPKSRTAPQAWGDPDFDTSWTMEAIDAPGAWLVPAAARCDAAIRAFESFQQALQQRDERACRELLTAESRAVLEQLCADESIDSKALGARLAEHTQQVGDCRCRGRRPCCGRSRGPC